MTTSIDSNVLIAFGRSDHSANKIAAALLSDAATKGPLCICGAVFSELLGYPGRSGNELRQFITSLGIRIDWQFGELDWEAAGKAYQGYVQRRRKSGGGLPRRVATDFLIGVHATTRGYDLLTLDKGLYKAAFPNLPLASIR
jgi:hypothetical protein